jgi:hypothetical protein
MQVSLKPAMTSVFPTETLSKEDIFGDVVTSLPRHMISVNMVDVYIFLKGGCFDTRHIYL